jgi:chromosome transmission fidelity protein 18
LYSSLTDFGDQDLVLGGLYESLPSIILFDMALIRTSLVLENMEISDMIQTKLSKSAKFSLMKYLPATTLRVAGILAGPENPSVRWPRTLPASIRDTKEKKMVLCKWMRSMKPETYTSLGKTPALLDVIPFLPWILAPNLRPVSRHLYSREEKKSVSRLVDAMLALGISYALEDSEDETKGAIQLTPPLHAFWDFPKSGSYCSQIPAAMKPEPMPVQTRQMVVHELDIERIKRGASHRVNGDQNLSQAAPVKEPASTTAVPITLAQRLEENRVKSKAAKKCTRKRNWFDDVKDKKVQITNKSIGQDKKFKAEDMPVLYKFHEGYTNAVKKPVKICEL